MRRRTKVNAADAAGKARTDSNYWTSPTFARPQACHALISLRHHRSKERRHQFHGERLRLKLLQYSVSLHTCGLSASPNRRTAENYRTHEFAEREVPNASNSPSSRVLNFSHSELANSAFLTRTCEFDISRSANSRLRHLSISELPISSLIAQRTREFGISRSANTGVLQASRSHFWRFLFDMSPAFKKAFHQIIRLRLRCRRSITEFRI